MKARKSISARKKMRLSLPLMPINNNSSNNHQKQSNQNCTTKNNGSTTTKNGRKNNDIQSSLQQLHKELDIKQDLEADLEEIKEAALNIANKAVEAGGEAFEVISGGAWNMMSQSAMAMGFGGGLVNKKD